jgi:hypothetical protein
LSKKHELITRLLDEFRPEWTLPQEPVEGFTLLEQGLLLVLMRQLTQNQAEATIRALRAAEQDWNELRVAQVQEVAQFVRTSSRKTGLELRREHSAVAQSIKDYLQDVYQQTHSLDLEFLRADPAEGGKVIAEFRVLRPGGAAYLLWLASDNQVPVHMGLIKLLDKLDLAPKTSSIKKAREAIEPLVPKGRELQFTLMVHDLLEHWTDEQQPPYVRYPALRSTPYGKKAFAEWESARARAEVQRQREQERLRKEEERAAKEAERERKRREAAAEKAAALAAKKREAEDKKRAAAAKREADRRASLERQEQAKVAAAAKEAARVAAKAAKEAKDAEREAAKQAKAEAAAKAAAEKAAEKAAAKKAAAKGPAPKAPEKKAAERKGGEKEKKGAAKGAEKSAPKAQPKAADKKAAEKKPVAKAAEKPPAKAGAKAEKKAEKRPADRDKKGGGPKVVAPKAAPKAPKAGEKKPASSKAAPKAPAAKKAGAGKRR